MWEKRIVHQGLHAYRMIRGSTQDEVEVKARLQLAAWEERWSRRKEIQAARDNRLSKKSGWELQVELDRRAKSIALELTKEAEKAIYEAKNLLVDALTEPKTFEWQSLKDTAPYSKQKPGVAVLKSLPPEPSRSERHFAVEPIKVNLRLLDWVIPGAKRKRESEALQEEKRLRDDANERFSRVHSEWERQYKKIDEDNRLSRIGYENAVAAWQKEKEEFEAQQRAYNDGIDEFKARYLSGSPDAYIRRWNEVLTHSGYPDSFPRDHVVSFDAASAILVVDYELPHQSALPRKKQVKYVASRQEFQDVFLSDPEFKRLYDDVLYQVCLRTLHELFQADERNVIGTVVFNGWVRSIDKATGSETHPCIMSVQVKKQEFLSLNLAQVELKACFRALRGVSGSKLVDLSPVRPVLILNRDDPRFVTAYSVAESIDDRTNLAAMDWLDFENLIREVFEKEFSKNGGNVKITRASRDGGVDAVAFDPDPIRGGKIVIQAKRYTNTVGVSAVRDLYGTVHNEGATKGILVTTSDYGPDAYEFAKGKPITLLSGSELLYLLGTHGYHAKIDLKEAKQALGEAIP